MGKIAGIISKVFNGKGIVDTAKGVADIVDQFNLSKEEKEQFKIHTIELMNERDRQIAEEAQKEFEMQLADVQDAREMNIKIQGDKPSWMAKNIAYVVDLWLSLIWGVFTIYMLAIWAHMVSRENIDMTGIISLYTTVTAVFMITVNYHRGSSGSSDKKQILIDKMAMKGQTDK